jgi:hypothetical protein
VHVFAEFSLGGETLVAHPVLIVETRSANAPRAGVPTGWKPFELAANRGLALWRLPESKPMRLRFANALRDHIPDRERPSDGVTFRVRVARWDALDGTQGEVVFERHTDAKVWLDGQADLSRFAGQPVRLQLESHPGPNQRSPPERRPRRRRSHPPRTQARGC